MGLMDSDRSNVIKTFNTPLLVTMLLIFGLGILTVYSATKGPGLHTLHKAQLMHFAFAVVIALPFIFIDSDILQKVAYLGYAFCLALLVLVLLVGNVGGGSQRWLRLGFFNLQPSELAKIGIVFTLAKYFQSERGGPPYNLKRLLIPAILVAPMFVLILLQPDLGTAGILFLAAGSMVLFLRVEWKSLVIVAILGAIAVPLAYEFVLHDYQRDRVKTFIDPGRDPKAKGYNSLQCKIAVGSGKLFGKGYLKGTQAQLNFIPEQHTDFIFSVFSEERGFVGCMVLLFLYAVYLAFALRTVARARDKFSMLLAFGLTAIVFWHVFVNIGMVSGILPIVGVTLPLFSYGGTSLLTFVLITALLLNLSRKKYIF